MPNQRWNGSRFNPIAYPAISKNARNQQPRRYSTIYEDRDEANGFNILSILRTN
jgi:hypothetical protein